MPCRTIKISLVVLVSFCIGLITALILGHYAEIKLTFWEFTLIDLVSLITYSVIAVYVAYHLRNRFSDRQMKRDFFLRIVDDIQKILEEKGDFLKSFMKDNPEDEATRTKLMILLRKISNKIRILELNKETFNENVAGLVEKIRNDYIEIKNIFTGDDYFANKSFTSEHVNKMTKYSDTIIFNLDQVKLGIFD